MYQQRMSNLFISSIEHECLDSIDMKQFIKNFGNL